MKFVIPEAAMRIWRKILGLLQIAVAYLIIFWTFRTRTNLIVDRSVIQGINPPFIVLGNHTSTIDPALVQYVVAPRTCYFLTTNFYFRLPIIGKILRLFGAIPKNQFSPDMRSMRGAMEVISRGDILGIFPEGRRSIDGSSCPIPDSIAKLIKKFKVPVVTVKTNGGYLVWPRWSSFLRPGRVETEVKQILSPEQICKMSSVEIYDVVCRSLAYNDYDWNRTARVLYRHNYSAEHLHLILHQCPRCLTPRKMKSKKHMLYCSACSNTAVMDAYGFLQPYDDQCVVFDDPVKWHAWQRENMIALLKNDDFQIQAKVKDLRKADKYYGPYHSCGHGQIILQKDGLYFQGKIDGQESELFFSLKTLPAVSTEFYFDFEVCDHEHAWMFFLSEEQQTIEIELAISLMHELTKHPS